MRISSRPGQQWRCNKQNPFPIEFIVLSLPRFCCSRTGPPSAVQTHSHSPTIIITCPMPPIHGAALLIYCSVSYMQTHTHPLSAALIIHSLPFTHTCTKTHADTTHNRKTPGGNSQAHRLHTSVHIRMQPLT